MWIQIGPKFSAFFPVNGNLSRANDSLVAIGSVVSFLKVFVKSHLSRDDAVDIWRSRGRSKGKGKSEFYI
jgi:hypothetical protein